MDIPGEFRAHLARHGIETPDSILADGVLHRAHVAGHKAGSKNLAYVLHLDGIPCGWFQEHKSGQQGTWKADGEARLDADSRARIESAQRQRREQEAARQESAAVTARRLWAVAKPLTGRGHPYLARKHVAAHGLCVLRAWRRRVQDDGGEWQTVTVRDVLLVPMIDAGRNLWSLQAIFPGRHPLLGRDKDFLPGARVGGLLHVIGKQTPSVTIAEGYATAATLYQETGYQTFVAFSAGNLLAVARTVRALRPGARIVIAADNDAHTPGNPGLTKATEAARAVGGLLAVPPIPGDWNDYHVEELKKSHGIQ